ncbi:MAG: hypothetical protein ABR899_06375, partial [Candidatus Krumholzibacteriaceae bacterium]
AASKSVESLSATPLWVYYADTESGTVARINVSSRKTEVLVGHLNSPTAVRWDATNKKLYILDAGTDANQFKDGTLKVVTGLN